MLGKIWKDTKPFGAIQHFYGPYLVNFGEDFFTAETVDEATRYLRKRFFVERSRLFQKEVILRDLPKQKGLNKLLASNWTFSTSYIRDVLGKEMLIKILQEHRSLEYETGNNICVKSEMSFINEKRNTVRQKERERERGEIERQTDR